MCHGDRLPDGLTAEQHREHQRANHCPNIPAGDWERDPSGANPPEWDLCSSPDENYSTGCHYCPGAYARKIEAIEARRALEWWETGQLALLCDGEVDESVIEAVEAARRARDAWRHERERILAKRK